MKDYSQEQPVLVEWEDTISPMPGWETIEEMTVPLNICHSVGWIVKREKRCVIIVSHITPLLQSGQAATGRITIPRSAIRSITPLSLVKKRRS